MHQFVMVAFVIALSGQAVELARNEREIKTRSFAIPVNVPAEVLDKIECVKLFISEDRGKSWKHEKDCKPTDKQFRVTAPDDGLYWFAVQVVSKDGKSEPAELKELQPAMKVYVNTSGRAVKEQKSYGDLVRETEELQRTIEQLRMRIKELQELEKLRRAVEGLEKRIKELESERKKMMFPGLALHSGRKGRDQIPGCRSPIIAL